MESTNWPPAHSDALRKYFALGMSYAEIARAINAEFNTSYSRCAAIGRARRLGLGTACRPGETATPISIPASTPRTRPQSLHKLGERYKAMAKWFVPFFEQIDAPKLRCVDADPLHLSLLALEVGDCRYPYGGDEEGEAITFCGRPKHGSSGPSALPCHPSWRPHESRMRGKTRIRTCKGVIEIGTSETQKTIQSRKIARPAITGFVAQCRRCGSRSG